MLIVPKSLSIGPVHIPDPIAVFGTALVIVLWVGAGLNRVPYNCAARAGDEGALPETPGVPNRGYSMRDCEDSGTERYLDCIKRNGFDGAWQDPEEFGEEPDGAGRRLGLKKRQNEWLKLRSRTGLVNCRIPGSWWAR